MMMLLRTPTTTAATKWLPRRAPWRTMRPLVVVPMTTITHHQYPTPTSSVRDSNAIGAVRHYHNHHTEVRFPNLSLGRIHPDFISSVLPPPTILSSMGCYQSDTTTITNHRISHPQYQQVRYKGRNDGNTQKHNTRKSTKKQQKVYHRKLQKQQLKTTGRHNPPNSKANLRRGYAERERAEILNTSDDLLLNPPAPKSKYDDTDALLDDMMGNAREVSPTPEPTYLGHLQSKYYTMVVDQMDDYFRRNASSSQVAQLTESTIDPSSSSSSSSSSAITTTPSHPADLPTDDLISKAVRAYRDRHGTRNRHPIGLRAALQHVLYDLQVPLVALGEYTYTTLLTCCRNPAEGRRVLQMIKEQGLPISSYSYSILCHLHAKTGDYQGCINVQQEMLQEQLSPTLVSYTSLLAACYKVSHNGRVAHPERALAVQAGWKKWQEMRIIGIEPDVMAYGAILRLKASIGKAEECLSLLNEMDRFKIYPTTLCYTTALQAVARSHAIAIRYEKGISRRNRRREMITTHHGKLARQIVIMAEGANFVPDEGFMSALCLCAGAAGDIATVKAIAVAYEILATQHDHLRTIGSNDHLQRLRDPNHGNESSPYHIAGDRGMLPLGNQSSAFSMASSSSMGQEYGQHHDQHKYDEPIIGAERRNHNDNHTEMSLRSTEFTTPSTNGSGSPHQQYRGEGYIPPFAEREYGRDNRLLSSIIHACAQAVDPNMMGTIWQGRENKGYLCINSLRLIQQIKIPQYTDNSIPEQTITDNLKIVQEDRDDGYREGKRRSRKFRGVDIDENVASTMEEMLGDKDLTRRYLNPDGRRKVEYRNATPDEIWKLKYGDDWDKETNDDKALAFTATTKNISASSTIGNNDTVERSEDDMINSYLESFDDSEDVNEVGDDSVGETNQNESKTKRTDNTTSDIYFDYETMRWKPISEQKKVPVTTSSHVSTKENPKEKVENVVVRDDPSSASTEEEMYFDTDIMRWKTRPKIQQTEPLSRTVKSTMTQVVHETPKDRYESKLKSNEERSGQDDESDLSDDDDDDDDGWESASDDSDEDEDYVFDKKKQEWVVKAQPSKQDASASIEEMLQGMNESGKDENFELEFHYDKSEYDQELVTKSSDSSDASNVVERSVSELERNEHVEAALYYDEKTQEWKMKNSDGIATKLEKQVEYSDEKSASTNVPASIADATSNESVIDKAAENEKAFAIFYADLRRESFENEQEDVTEEEACELFDIMKDEYNEMIVMTPEELGLEDHPVVVEQRTQLLPKDEPSASGAVEEQDAPLSQSFNEENNTPNLQSARSFPFEKSSSAYQNADISVNVAATRSLESSSSFTPQQLDTTVEKFWGDSNFGTSTQTVLLDPSYENHSYSQDVDELERTTEVAQVNTGEDTSHISSQSSSHESGVGGSSSLLQFFEMFSTDTDDVVEDYRLTRLRELLPHFSDRRLIKIVQCYQRSLGDPSILELIPIVRENMPDYITSTWLKQMATMTAKSAIQKAAQNELINPEILNSVLELHTSSGSLDRAIEFHQTEFAAHNLEPTEYSDRLVVQMLLRNNRFNRALDFKQTVQSSGRSLDIKAYGSLVEFCARRKQLGSALLLLKECLSTHGAAPGEASLSNLRILCRQAGIVDEIGLERMIGTDPIEWLRQGEREKKREYSKKGRRNVQLARNVMLRL